jgi:hypothetical protein
MQGARHEAALGRVLSHRGFFQSVGVCKCWHA